MMKNKPDLITIKKSLLYSILERIDSPNQSSEHLIAVLEENEKIIEQIKDIDTFLSKEELESFNKNNELLIKNVIAKQQAVINKLKMESAELNMQMNQISRQKKGVNNYMDKKDSMFVDREV